MEDSYPKTSSSISKIIRLCHKKKDPLTQPCKRGAVTNTDCWRTDAAAVRRHLQSLRCISSMQISRGRGPAGAARESAVLTVPNGQLQCQTAAAGTAEGRPGSG